MSDFNGFDDGDDDFGDFGDFGDFDSGDFTESSSGEDSEGQTSFEGTPEEVKSTKKVALLVVGLGIVVTVLALVIMNRLNSEPKNNNKVNIQKEEGYEKETVPIVGKEEWVDIEFVSIDNFVVIDSTFTVTAVKHYVKVMLNDELVMKTVAQGSLSGFGGTYSIELPYRELKVGDKFSLPVKVGEYKGKSVISY